MPCTKQLNIDTSQPVLVTGATGYVAGVLIQQLLEAGVTVHATVRDPSQTERVQYLQDLADQSGSGTIRFFRGDLLQEDSFDEGMKGCGIVFHTASPFQLDYKDAYHDLVQPAVRGTQIVFHTASRTPSVKRVVLTSSCVAIYTDISECDAVNNKSLNEETWNRTASLDYQPYSLSKTLAEQKAWEIAGSQTAWKLVTINPSLVFGPGVKYHESSTSFSLMKQLGDGSMPLCPNMGMGMVDVRDVAAAHIAAAYLPEASGRHVLSGHNSSLLTMARLLSPKFPDYPVPTRAVPKPLLWLLAPYLPGGMSRRYVWNNINVEASFDHTKSVTQLGIQYRPLDETGADMFQQLVDLGVLTKK
jgi:dihydroflavonol-4-reductase